MRQAMRTWTKTADSASRTAAPRSRTTCRKEKSHRSTAAGARISEKTNKVNQREVPTRPSRKDQPPRHEPQHIHTTEPPNENRNGQHDSQISGDATERGQDGQNESHGERARSSMAIPSLDRLHARSRRTLGDQVDPARPRWRRGRPLTLEKRQPLMQRRQRSLDPVERGIQSRSRSHRSGRRYRSRPRDGSQIGSGEGARNGSEGRRGRSSGMRRSGQRSRRGMVLPRLTTWSSSRRRAFRIRSRARRGRRRVPDRICSRARRSITR